MQPAVEAAWIAAGVGLAGIAGTVIVAITGAVNVRKTTEATIRSDRQLRLWERRAAAYEEALSDILRRQDIRRKALRDVDEPTFSMAKAKAAMDAEVRTREAEGRLLAYASEAVQYAFNECWGANDHFENEYRWLPHYQRGEEKAGGGPSDTDAPGQTSGWQLTNWRDAARRAAYRDDELIVAIRAELKVEPLTPDDLRRRRHEEMSPAVNDDPDRYIANYIRPPEPERFVAGPEPDDRD